MGNVRKIDSLSEEQIKEMQSAYQILKKVKEFEDKANLKLFKYLFEEDRAEHMFVEVFVKRCGRNGAKFMMSIDDKARIEVSLHVFGYDSKFGGSNPLYAHC